MTEIRKMIFENTLVMSLNAFPVTLGNNWTNESLFIDEESEGNVAIKSVGKFLINIIISPIIGGKINRNKKTNDKTANAKTIKADMARGRPLRLM